MRIACRLVISFAMAFSLTASAATKEVVELGQRLERLKEPIRLTKERLKRPQDVEFLPDLYFMMAELLIESSRVAISLKQAKQPKTPIDELDFTAEKRPKLEAIEIYRQIEGRFPKYAKLDKVLFFQAHEHRELGQADEALALYKKIVDQYPGSAHWDEAQLNIGNHYFEKKDFDFALEQYQKIIAKERSKAAAAAYYKMGWCHVNKGKWVESLDSYRKSVDAFTNIAGQFKPTDIKNADMREEALVASVWPYTELKPEEVLKIPDAVTPVKFYRGLAPDKFVYARVMSRLGRRLVIKKRFSDAATAHLEALKSLEDPVARMDALEDYYRAFKETKDEFFPAGISGVVAETFIWLNELERDLKPQQRRTTKYEPIFRDIAMPTKRAEDLLQAARAYEDYLFIYPKSKSRAAMSTNLA